MQKLLLAAVITVLFGMFLLLPNLSEAKSSEITREILDILHSQGDISDEKYEALKEKAAKEDDGFTTSFNKQLSINSTDGRFKIQAGGRIMIDAGHFSADKAMEAAAGKAGFAFEGNGVEFRQTRLHIKGLLYGWVAFSNEFDFSAGDVSFQENWIELQKLPYLGSMRIGHTKEPFSLERMNSRLYLMLMEQSLPVGIVPGRNVGIRFLNFVDNLRVSWCAGVFKETDNGGEGYSDNGDYNFTARLTVTPWYVDDGRNVLHLGLGYSHKVADESLRFRKRPETHLSDFQLIDTGNIPADGADMLGPEAAIVLGPFCLQGEYWYTRVDSETYDDPVLQGYYITAAYFITGEHRNYQLKGNDGAEFALVNIQNPVNPGRDGWGAWEAAVRYACVDLNDNDLNGGEMASVTLGLNWYINSNLRWSVNYVHSKVEDSTAKAGITDAEADIYQTRLSVYF